MNTNASEPKNEGMPPEMIDVLGKSFNVKILAPDESEGNDGYMDLSIYEIGVRMHPSNDYNKDTVFHELTHAIDEVMALKLKEHQVHQLAVGWMAVLKHNPKLAKWLLNDK
jgi:hypothetical protein